MTKMIMTQNLTAENEDQGATALSLGVLAHTGQRLLSLFKTFADAS
jgi:hypothetical protein